MKILLAIDASQDSDAVIDAILAQRPARETTIRVLQVLEPPPLLVAREMGGYDPELETVLQEQREEANAKVARVVELLRSHGFDARELVEEGDPKAKILEIAGAWPADLIVLGAHEQNGLQGILSRSVTQSVAKHAPCSVEIVRNPAPRSPARARHAHAL
jgi:nucleotide-binding universal stress UspA family protein